MGSWKPLLPWGESILVEAAIAAARAAGCRVILVTGFRGAELAGLLEAKPGLAIVHNPEWERGMLGSILRGAEASEGGAFFVAPADMPSLPPAAFRALAEAREARLAAGGDEAVFFAAAGGEAGHPVLIPRVLLPGMRGLDPGGRLRAHLLGLPHALVECGDRGVLADLDTPEEYRRARGEAR